LDTRSLAGFLHRAAPDARVVTNTVGHEHAWDVRFARAIAKELGWPHVFLPVEPSFVADHAEAGLSALEGNGLCSTFWVMAELPFLDELRPAVTWSGFLGCCLSGANLPRKHPPATGKDAVDALWRYKFTGSFTDEDLAALLKPGVYADAGAEPYEAIRRRFRGPPPRAVRVHPAPLRRARHRRRARPLDVCGPAPAHAPPQRGPAGHPGGLLPGDGAVRRHRLHRFHTLAAAPRAAQPRPGPVSAHGHQAAAAPGPHRPRQDRAAGRGVPVPVCGQAGGPQGALGDRSPASPPRPRPPRREGRTSLRPVAAERVPAGDREGPGRRGLPGRPVRHGRGQGARRRPHGGSPQRARQALRAGHLLDVAAHGTREEAPSAGRARPR